MDSTLLMLHAGIGIVFILSVLVQDKGTGMGSAIGGVAGTFHASQRGAAKVLHYVSVTLGTLFLLTALLYAVVPQSALPPAAPSPAVSDTSGINPESISVETSDGTEPLIETVPAE